MKSGIIKKILNDHWMGFLKLYNKKIRKNVKREVEKVLKCKDIRYGYIEFKCDTCNITKKVVIVEESQNFYIDELKKVLTRVSDTSKIIVIGHSGQCDLYHNPERSGFVPYIEHFKGQPYAQICTLTTNYRGKVSAYADEL